MADFQLGTKQLGAYVWCMQTHQKWGLQIIDVEIGRLRASIGHAEICPIAKLRLASSEVKKT